VRGARERNKVIEGNRERLKGETKGRQTRDRLREVCRG